MLDHRQTCRQGGYAAPPLRAARMGRGDDRHPVLDHRRSVRQCRARSVLRRLGLGHQGNVMGPATIDELRGRKVLVAGLGASGRSALEVLTEVGAQVVAADADPGVADRVQLPAQVRLVAEADPDRLAEAALATEPDLVVASPGWSPRAPLLARSEERRVEEECRSRGTMEWEQSTRQRYVSRQVSD